MAERTPVGDMPRMVPDRDEIRGRQPTAQDRKGGSGRPPQKSTGNSWVTITLLLVSGVAIAGLALQQYSLSQMLSSYEERLDLANDRIVTLEQSLTQTDESVSMNGTAINAQFQAIKAETDMQMSEIRKLWDVTNKRNRQWIEDNQALLASQNESLAALQASISDLSASQDSDEQVLTSLQAQARNDAASLATLNADVAAIEANLASTSEAIAALQQLNYEEQFLTLTLTQENLLVEQGQMNQAQVQTTEQVTEIQETLRSIDVGRQETSRRLTTLVNQLANLESRFAALTGAAQ